MKSFRPLAVPKSISPNAAALASFVSVAGRPSLSPISAEARNTPFHGRFTANSMDPEKKFPSGAPMPAPISSKSCPHVRAADFISPHRRSIYCSKLSCPEGVLMIVGMDDSQYILPSRSTNPNLVLVPPMSIPTAAFFIDMCCVFSVITRCNVWYFVRFFKI